MKSCRSYCKAVIICFAALVVVLFYEPNEWLCQLAPFGLSLKSIHSIFL